MGHKTFAVCMTSTIGTKDDETRANTLCASGADLIKLESHMYGEAEGCK